MAGSGSGNATSGILMFQNPVGGAATADSSADGIPGTSPVDAFGAAATEDRLFSCSCRRAISADLFPLLVSVETES